MQTVFFRVTLLLSLGGLSGCQACDKLRNRGASEDAGMDAAPAPSATASATPDAAAAPTASAEPATSAAPSATASAHPAASGGGGAAANASAPVGTFVGTLTEHGTTYSVTIVMPTENAGTVAYGTPYTCKGTLTLSSKNEPMKIWHYKEKITDQGTGRKCATSANDNISLDKNGHWFFSAAAGAARGPITRK